jgi:hypothetical protein
MSKSRFVTVSFTAFVLFASLTALAARAQTTVMEAVPSHPALTDRFTFDLGAYYSRSSTEASLGPSGGGTGVSVNFEDTLGLEDRSLLGIGGFLWRISERWRLEVDYFNLSRDATRTLAESFTWGDETFNVGDTINSTFDFTDIRISGGYSFFKRRDKEVGAGLGFHVAKIKASIATTSGIAEGSDVTAPLPVLNLYGMFALTNEWALRMRVDWLSLNYDIYSGDVRNTSVDFLYRPFRNVGFGVGVRNLVLNLEIDDPDWHGRARMVFTGPTAFMSVSF